LLSSEKILSENVLAALAERDIKGHEIFEIGSDTVRYKALIALCGKSILGMKNIIITIPFFAIRMSALWPVKS
jgi:hypothetical protein